MPRVLVTGATGFVGLALRSSTHSWICVHVVLRRHVGDEYFDVEQAIVGDLLESPDWTAAVRSVDLVVHLASRVHVSNESTLDVEWLY